MLAAVGAVATWWVWVLIGLGVAVITYLMVSRLRHRDLAARGWRSRASELYTRSVALHDRLAPSLGTAGTLSPEAIDRLGDAEWMVEDVSVAVAALEVGAPDERARLATNDLTTSLDSVREGIHLRVQMPDSAESAAVMSTRLADLQECLGRFREVVRSSTTGAGGTRGTRG
jgi:hypothetical protein